MIECGLGVKFSGAFDGPYLVILEVFQNLFMQVFQMAVARVKCLSSISCCYILILFPSTC